MDFTTDQTILSGIIPDAEESRDASYLIVQEAWNPPIRETLEFIKNLREAVGPGALIHVGLIGKPNPDTVFTPARGIDHSIWHDAILSLGDPKTGVKRLVQ